MNYQLSVLLYSKYSNLSKDLTDLIQSSGVDFEKHLSLQFLCIDNEKIRKRITNNKQINITSVPCILLIYSDGGIEKYDGNHAFEWVNDIISTVQQQQVQQQVQQQQVQQQQVQQQQVQQQVQPYYEDDEDDETVIKKKMSDKKRRIRDKERLKNMKKYERQLEEEVDNEIEQEKPQRKLIRPRKAKTVSKSVTSIDELPSEEDDEEVDDRYRSRKPVGLIRSDEGNYTDGEGLFQGEKPNVHAAGKSNVKGLNHNGSIEVNDANTRKSVDLMSKAKELAKGREEASPPPGHPLRQQV